MPTADLYRVLWRRRWMILLATALAGVAAYVFSSAQPKIYEATALVRIQQRLTADDSAFGSVNSLELGQRLAQTYARIVETRAISTKVANALKGKVPSDDIAIAASPDLNVELLEIAARSESPVNATRVANAAAASLNEFVKETGTLRDQIVVVDPATVPSTPVAPRPKLTVAVVVLLALLLNFALALALELFSDRLPEVDDFEERFGIPVLSTVPLLSLKTAAEALTTVTPARSARQASPDATRARVAGVIPAGEWPSPVVPRAPEGEARGR